VSLTSATAATTKENWRYRSLSPLKAIPNLFTSTSSQFLIVASFFRSQQHVITSTEAVWNFLGYPMLYRYPASSAVHVHLPGRAGSARTKEAASAEDLNVRLVTTKHRNSPHGLHQDPGLSNFHIHSRRTFMQVDPTDYWPDDLQPDEHYRHTSKGIAAGNRRHYTPTLFERYLNRPTDPTFDNLTIPEVYPLPSVTPEAALAIDRC